MGVFLALVSQSEDVDGTARLDFKQRDVSGGAKVNDELSQEWIVGERLAPGEGREAQQLHRPLIASNTLRERGPSDAHKSSTYPLNLEAGVGIEPAYTALQAAA